MSLNWKALGFMGAWWPSGVSPRRADIFAAGEVVCMDEEASVASEAEN